MSRGSLGGGRSGLHPGLSRGGLPSGLSGRGGIQTGGGRGALFGLTSQSSGLPLGGGRGQSNDKSRQPAGNSRRDHNGSSDASKDLSDDLENFKPMQEAYNDPVFNSYTGFGPGSSLHKSQHVDGRREGDKLVKLHVANIPNSMSQRAVENIFTLYGDTVSVFISSCSGPTNWGFVEYKKLEEAQNAIVNLDRKPPHNLTVKFAKEKEPRETNPQDINTPFCKVDTSNRGRKTLPLQGGDPRKIQPRANNYNGRNAVESNGYHNGQFSNYNATHQVEVNNIVSEKLTTTSGNGMVVRGGRAYNPPRTPPKPEPKAPDTSITVEKFKNPAHPEEVNPPEVTCPFKQGNCTNCQAISATVCHVCKAWFCSYTCMENDWGKHKLVCRPRTVTFRPDGTIDYHDSQDQKIPPTEQKHDDQVRPIKPERCPGVSPSFEDSKPRDVDRKSEISQRKSLEAEPSNKAEEPQEARQLKKDDKRSNSVVRQIDYTQHPPEPRDDGYVLTQNGVTTNRNAKFEANIQKRDLESQTRSQITDRQIAESVRCDKPLKTASVALPATKKKPLPEPPIPRGTFSKCLVLFTTPGDERLAVTPISLAANQDEMMADLAEYFCQPRENIQNLSEGTICGAVFDDGLWYRVKVSSINMKTRSALIYFIDFGNDYEVSIDGLKKLPDRLLEVPPMAFHIVFVGGKKNFQINDSIDISPIKPTPCGSWLVRTPEDPEPPEEVEILAEELPAEIVQETPVQEDSSTEAQGYPLSKLKFMPVTVMHVEEPGTFWVITQDGMLALLELNQSLAESARSKVKVTPEIGQMYNCLFSGIWCRALLTGVNPHTVFFIDYGNAMEVTPSELLPLPLKLKSLCPLAIRIKLAEGTSSKYFSTEEMGKLSVRALEKVQNVVIVLVEGESYIQSVLDHELSQAAEPPKPKRPNHVVAMLTPKSDAFVAITKAFGEDYFCGSLQISNGPEQFQSVDMISKTLKTKKANPNYVPVVNDDVIVKINKDSRLYRGYIMCVEEEGSSVALVDLGCVETPCKLASLPQEFKDIPPCGVRVILHTPTSSSLSALLGSELSLKNIKIKGDEVTADLGSFGRATIKPWLPMIEEVLIPAFKLENHTSAMVTAFHSPQAVYVRPLTPACIEVFSCVLQDVCAFCITAEPLQTPPLLGEIVAARWNVDNNFYRALVSKKENDSFKVIFLDFGNLETAVLDDLRKLPDNFKKIPATVVKIGLKDVPGPIFNLSATQLMNDIVAKESKLEVRHEGDLRNAVLVEESSGDVVNKILAQAMEPSWTENASKMHMVRSYMNTDLRYDVWEEGTKLEGAVVGVPSYSEILFVNRSDLFEYIHSVLTPQMTSYCRESKQTRYNPRPNELVLAQFEGDWYRAVVIDETRMAGDNTAMVFFIDYGNMGEMAIEELRKIVPEFAAIPAAVKRCKIAGLPRSESISDDVKAKITAELTALGSIELTVVKQFDGGYSVVWVPALEEASAKLGITLNRPVGFC